jgi:hypothetical protein
MSRPLHGGRTRGLSTAAELAQISDERLVVPTTRAVVRHAPCPAINAGDPEVARPGP